ncbi:hypothetical protein AMR41_21545 [Hapalosiphon sp. MRB220]|nr:hypothetical protein AMR41_21545 [Hapalosiphon sp. MRB220]
MNLAMTLTWCIARVKLTKHHLEQNKSLFTATAESDKRRLSILVYFSLSVTLHNTTPIKRGEG